LERRLPGSPRLTVAVDRTTISTSIGKTFALRATIANRSSAPANDLIVHLNVLSPDGDVYVDPEDWSSNRTRYLAPIPAGRSATVSWKLQAVNSGRIGVYVAVLPHGGAPEAAHHRSERARLDHPAADSQLGRNLAPRAEHPRRARAPGGWRPVPAPTAGGRVTDSVS
jgi:hypothetical protein